MSLILDALRKSERTRQQSLSAQLGAGETPAAPGRLPIPWVPLLAVLLLLNGALLWLFWPRGEPALAPNAAAPAMPAHYRPAVRPLSGETQSMDEHIPVIPPPPVSRMTPPGNPSVAAPQQALAPPTVGNVESLDSLPADVRASLPALHLDVLGYAPRPAERFVVINLRRYAAGDTLSEGPRLLDIVAGGAVLQYHGTTFLLPP